MNMRLLDIGASRRWFGLAMAIGLLHACSASAPDSAAPATSPTASATPVRANPIAKISEIRKLPVFVRLLSAAQEQPAKEGMGLQTGETIRTQGQALTQIDLNNGLAFRLAGDAVLTLKPDNRLNLTAGDMITWVQPGKKIPTEIVTPTAVAGIRGTTVFVKIPKDPQEGVLFFAWEGSVAVRLPGEKEEVLLKTAEEVRIRPGDRDIRQIRQRVRRINKAEWRQKRQTDPMLRSFKKAKMSTLSIIERIKPGEVKLSEPTTPPGEVKKSKADSKQAHDRTFDHAKQTSVKLDKALALQNKPGAHKPASPGNNTHARDKPEPDKKDQGDRARLTLPKREQPKPAKVKPAQREEARSQTDSKAKSNDR